MNPYGNSPDPREPEYNRNNNDPFHQDFPPESPDRRSPENGGFSSGNLYQQPRRYKEPGSPGMAMASVILGICSFIFMLSGLSPVLGGLGILLALLSRGCGKLSGTAKAGLIASCCGLVIGTFVLGALSIVLFRSISTTDYSDLLEQYYYEYSDEYNDSFPYSSDEYPDSFGDYYPEEGGTDGYSWFFGDEWNGDSQQAPSDGGLI